MRDACLTVGCAIVIYGRAIASSTYEMGRVKVTVVSCDGLPAKDVSGTTDAFIKVAVEDGIPGQVTFQTKVHNPSVQRSTKRSKSLTRIVTLW
jgi:hypothetical protein